MLTACRRVHARTGSTSGPESREAKKASHYTLESSRIKTKLPKIQAPDVRSTCNSEPFGYLSSYLKPAYSPPQIALVDLFTHNRWLSRHLRTLRLCCGTYAPTGLFQPSSCRQQMNTTPNPATTGPCKLTCEWEPVTALATLPGTPDPAACLGQPRSSRGVRVDTKICQEALQYQVYARFVGFSGAHWLLGEV